MASTPVVGTDRVFGILSGAAVGDALGWPQEIRSNIVGGQKARNVPAGPQFRAWRRNSGTQFARYQEEINAGDYSDDTQLILAVARSCLYDDWFSYLTKVELPTWLLYHRGAGRAILSAARAWAAGRAPWVEGSSTSMRAKSPVVDYFNAGGNGAAMRIAPHAIADPEMPIHTLLKRIVLDSAATHGHPRALVGAVLHGLAIRKALLQEGTLEYGSLIEALLDDHSWQTGKLLHESLPPDWLQTYTRIMEQPAEVGWMSVVREAQGLLLTAQRSLERAALANDEKTLEAMGVFDKTRNGAGTITAVAAIYMATRSAARPLSGLVRCAFLPNADTDTLASMCASLLGAIHGTAWLGPLLHDVQDSKYLYSLAQQLAGNARRDSGQQTLFSTSDTIREVDLKLVERFRNSLFGEASPTPKRFPDGRLLVAQERRTDHLKNGLLTHVQLMAEDGQTVFINRFIKTTATEHNLSYARSSGSLAAKEELPAYDLEVNLGVSSLARATHFYCDILGLRIVRATENSVALHNGLSLTKFPQLSQYGRAHTAPTEVLITIQVRNFDAVAHRAFGSDLAEVLSIDNDDKPRRMRLRDPDGYNLQILSR
ncbi:ADP-ribosylglycohydrolase family protein [Microbispora sp. H10836]|uniref:ADP-ribosylglycohydrolase family protein n=1 Tax=Microbispora sp. H10836 TaxID=2729106 RepID=UPI0014733D41|nr:ADP-ribosylglycohydrolase family protein [Microbispora sp. H10836]